MRIMLVSYLFPPYNTIGAVRVGKTAKYLRRLGHEVRVLTARDLPLQGNLRIEVPPTTIRATKWRNVNAPVEWAMGGRGQVAAKGYAVGGGSSWKSRLLRGLGRLYKTWLNVPDGQIGWYGQAVRAGSRWIKEWRPDVILASGAPFTSLLVARTLSKRHGVPFVAELRDLWTDNAQYGHPRWRRALESRLETWTLSQAAGLITVSEPLAQTLRAKYEKPVQVVLNGYDPEDLPSGARPPLREDGLDLIYTGMVYEGKQDPAPLFAALQAMGEEAKRVRVSFYGRYLESVREQARRYGVERQVEIEQQVSYEEALRLQARADLLLLLQWNDPEERGVYTGKLFEYIGAGRPILAVGYGDNVAGDLIRERGAGVVLDDPQEIASQLRRWLWVKARRGEIPAMREEAALGLTREAQARETAAFLQRVLGEEVTPHGGTAGSPERIG
ncbi:glycosyltransferase [Tumebacillus sp. DT12]|uniref:Glycosyltransferase n=1 Tax=Tumebacillus lacus TaxID=2995335 RepID=A0ABT3WZN4_9BACL|nr:glycosyltransferase [Tumebacillus lacus]MCX7570122.1 glycosyltransferase [Tumebacillus lacus]